MIEIKIPFKTPTINHLYWHRGNMRIMTKEAKELRKKINEIVWDGLNEWDPLDYVNKKLKVVTEIHENWMCKNGKVARKDISNREKFLIDSIFDSLSDLYDDKFIFEHTMKKIQSETEFALIRIDNITKRFK